VHNSVNCQTETDRCCIWGWCIYACIYCFTVGYFCQDYQYLEEISAGATSIPLVILFVRALAKALEEEVEGTGIHSMRSEMLFSRFDDDTGLSCVSYTIGPTVQRLIFSSRLFCKTLLVDEYLFTKVEFEISELAAKRVASGLEEKEISFGVLRQKS